MIRRAACCCFTEDGKQPVELGSFYRLIFTPGFSLLTECFWSVQKSKFQPVILAKFYAPSVLHEDDCVTLRNIVIHKCCNCIQMCICYSPILGGVAVCISEEICCDRKLMTATSLRGIGGKRGENEGFLLFSRNSPPKGFISLKDEWIGLLFCDHKACVKRIKYADFV